MLAFGAGDSLLQVSPRRSSKSSFAGGVEPVQPEGVVALITEVLRLGGGISEDALWSSCTVLEKLAEKDPRMATIFLARGGRWRSVLGGGLGGGLELEAESHGAKWISSSECLRCVERVKRS